MDEQVTGIKFKDNDGIQIMKDYMASGSFAPFPPEMGTDTAFLDRIHCYLPDDIYEKYDDECNFKQGLH